MGKGTAFDDISSRLSDMQGATYIDSEGYTHYLICFGNLNPRTRVLLRRGSTALSNEDLCRVAFHLLMIYSQSGMTVARYSSTIDISDLADFTKVDRKDMPPEHRDFIEKLEKKLKGEK